MKTISIRLPEELETRIRAAAQARRVSRSKLIRDVLARNFRDDATSNGRSAYEEMMQGLGVTRSGFSDLATGSDHLEGFGK